MVVTVGTPFTVSMIRIIRYDENWTDSHNLADFYRRLRRLFYRGLPEPGQRDERDNFLGYREIIFFMKIDGQDHQFSLKEGETIWMKHLGFDPLPENLAKRESKSPRIFLGPNTIRARDFRLAVQRMIVERSGFRLRAYQKDTHGALGYALYVNLDFDRTRDSFLRGVISFERDETHGNIYRKFYDLEGGNRPEGRGDHVGAFGGSDW